MGEANAANRGLPLRPWFAVVLFVGALCFQLGFGLVLTALSSAGVFGETRAQVRAVLFGPAGLSVQIAITSVFLVAIVVAALLLAGRAPARALGARRPRLVTLAVAAVSAVPLGFLVDQMSFALNALAPSLFTTRGLEDMAGVFAGASPAGFLVATAAITIGPALGEEALFRGVLLRSFAAAMPRWAAVFVSALLFGAIHMGWLQGAGAFAVGLYMGFAVLATGSLWTGVAIHAANNLACALFARLDPHGAGIAFTQGHHLAVLAASLIAVVAAAAYLAGQRRAGV